MKLDVHPERACKIQIAQSGGGELHAVSDPLSIHSETVERGYVGQGSR
jgi:hypothetical protein